MTQIRGWWRNTKLCTYYAQVAAVVLVLVGLAGIMGSLSWQYPSGIYHVSIGLIFGYVGFFMRDLEAVRQIVGGLGVLLLVIKVATILTPLLWEEHLHWGPIEVTCLVVGIPASWQPGTYGPPHSTEKGSGREPAPSFSLLTADAEPRLCENIR